MSVEHQEPTGLAERMWIAYGQELLTIAGIAAVIYVPEDTEGLGRMKVETVVLFGSSAKPRSLVPIHHSVLGK